MKPQRASKIHGVRIHFAYRLGEIKGTLQVDVVLAIS
jgi:hypothetical protein